MIGKIRFASYSGPQFSEGYAMTDFAGQACQACHAGYAGHAVLMLLGSFVLFGNFRYASYTRYVDNNDHSASSDHYLIVNSRL